MNRSTFFFLLANFFILIPTLGAWALPATTHYVDFGGTRGYTYYPNSITFEIGDTIVFRGDFVTYPLISVSVPQGAQPFGPINTGATFSYIVDVPGNYTYQNKVYASIGMKGSFTGIRLPHGSLTNEGREFYLGLLFPTFNSVVQQSLQPYYKAYALITTYYANTVNVSFFDASGTELFPTMTKVPARGTFQIPLNVEAMRMDVLPEGPMARSCHITSKYPITVQFVSVGANAGGSYLALPVLGLGKNYVVSSYNDNAGNGALSGAAMGYPATVDIAGGQFMVIATEDGTNVKIIPNTTTMGGHVGFHTGTGAKNKAVPYTVGLNRGQCYLVRSNGKDASQDISGSTVEASKPVAVIAGAEDATLGGVSPYINDARDFMIEQMTPVEVWDTAGYMSIPFIEAIPPGAEGHGDNYRVYTFDTAAVKVQADVIGIAGGYPMNTTRLASPPAEKFDIYSPVDIYSTNGRKISVTQYEERSQPAKAPYTAPSVMTIVPHSRWRKAYNFSVLIPPTDHGVVGNQYLDILADSLNTIMVSANGAIEHPIITALANVGSVNVVSKNSTNVKAARYRIGSGSFYLHSDFPFAVYSYGMNEYWWWSWDFKQYEQFESECAAPAGMQLNTGITPAFTYTIDTLPNCMGWNICVRDTGKNDPGLRIVTLVDDSDAVYYGKIGAKYKNVTFDSSSLDLSNGELLPHWHSGQPYCFTVKITDRLASAFAPIGLIDNNGNGILLRLNRTAPEFTLKTSPISSPRPDSIYFPLQKVGAEICTTFVFKNTGATGSTAINFLSADLKHPDPAFTITAVTPKLPYKVAAQDSIKMEICFRAEDSLRHKDSLVVKTDCFDVSITLDAHSATGLINSDNIDFGSVTVGEELCKFVTIRNSGSLAFTLTKSWLLSDTVNFAVDPKSSALLPAVIPPGKYFSLNICFHPKTEGKDSASIHWTTDIDSVYADALKSNSFLRGTGKPVVVKSVHSVNDVPESLNIRPNPASGNLVEVSFPVPLENHVTLAVFDVLGRELYKKELMPGISQLEVPVRNLSEGIYYIRVVSVSGILTQKMEIRR